MNLFNPGDYFDKIEKKFEKEKVYCNCLESTKVNYKINALKRVLSHERFKGNIHDKMKLKSIGQL